jgi:hypothetical protein
MNTKEILVEIDNLQEQANNLIECINKGVYKYLKDTIGIESCGGAAVSAASDSLIGKVVAEEISWYWNREINLITISYYVFKNKLGDFSDVKEINVDFSVIDKYIEM